ncbi:MAG: anti-sigma factor [Chroococcidiopsidaceae cyanobacterium CP_BM_ER_R8_30]|nr:anti-sigma factor [Chroococcidiopsidaceae cyanobacterium CP_BM_ER_R8_30]
MNVPSNPEYLEELAAGYVVGDLDPEEAEELRQLLRDNPDLITQVNLLEEVLEQVLYGLNEVEPPPQLGPAILEAAALPAKRDTVLRRPALPWGKFVGSVAALFILVLGLANYRLQQELRIAKAVPMMLQNSETRLFSLKGTNLASAASGNIVMDLESQRLALVIQHLPVAPVGHVYRLWAVVDGDKLPCGQVRARAQGIVLDKLSVPADLYNEVSGLIVTLEPSPVTPEPVGPIVMKSI